MLFDVLQLEADNTKFIEDILLAYRIIKTGVPNRYRARISLKTTRNLPLFHSLLYGYEDRENISEWLKYGFLVSRDPWIEDPSPVTKNIQELQDTQMSLTGTWKRR